ncbi:MAG: arsenate reductase [Cyanobacteria bacterium RYN_339]|nr:arsenate reductase [Cyanobacteria bacterium RYN_339]
MADVTIYHNPRCSKSRQALALLQEGGREPQVVKYLDTPPDEATLDRLLTQLGLEPQALMRTGEDRYAELGLATKQMTRAEAVRVLAQNPILIERPIVVVGDRAVVARPPERVRELLS